MRAIQAYHQDVKGWNDIAYSFVIDPATLTIYEGRGAGIAGGHTEGHNTISHAICVMGNFENDKVPPGLVSLLREFIAYGDARGWWRSLSGGHRDASGASTACPGRNLYATIPSITSEQDEDDMFTDQDREDLKTVLRHLDGTDHRLADRDVTVSIRTALRQEAKAIRDLISPEAFAEAVVSRLPDGDLDAETVKQAVNAAFSEAFADPSS